MRCQPTTSPSRPISPVVPVLASMLLVVLTWAVSGAWSGSRVAGQGATPAASPVPAASCQVEPRIVTDWDGTPAAGIEVPPVSTDGPFVPPTGVPADDETVAAVTATISESVACANAGDFPRLLALASDRFVRALFTGDAAAPEADVLAAINAPATPLPEEERLTLLAIDAIVLLDDGRVAATVSTHDARYTYADVLYFVNETGRWLIDDSVAIDSSTQVEASPAATP